MKELMAEKIIRGYAWWLLENNLEWTVDSYNGRVPIVPFSDDPELRMLDKPYLVYGFTETQGKSDKRVTDGTLTFNIISKQLSDISRVSRVLEAAFSRDDLSAKDLNQFSTTAGYSEFDGLTFHYTNVTFVAPGSPEKEDEGPILGAVVIEYCYKDHFIDDPDKDGILLRPLSGSF